MIRALIALSALAMAGDASAQVIKAPAGAVEGKAVRGVSVFKGIPFAQPPIGPLRWKAPVALAPWQGVRKPARGDLGGLPHPQHLDAGECEECAGVRLAARRRAHHRL
jgi:hypothetical protein